jgi:hypothetical protein
MVSLFETVLRRTFETRRGENRKLEQISESAASSFYTSPNIITVIKSKRIK